VSLSYLIVTGHDPRSRRRANIHFIAEELAKRGKSRVFSVGFSPLSNIRAVDPRIGLERIANRVESYGKVDCFLWRTAIHPFNPRRSILQNFSHYFYDAYVSFAPSILERWAAGSDVIIIESGLPITFLEKLRRASPFSRILYLASDDNNVIGCDPHVNQVLWDRSDLLDGAILPSPLLRPSIPPEVVCCLAPHGFDPIDPRALGPNPYHKRGNAVSVGSMLFDPIFFTVAADYFPDLDFHVIGSGRTQPKGRANIYYHDEMPYIDTLRYLKHADIGIAPYKGDSGVYYLCDTSMKLRQYQYFDLPAVCPDFAVGDNTECRFGYNRAEPQSIKLAIERALDYVGDTARSPVAMPTWERTVDIMLDTQSYIY